MIAIKTTSMISLIRIKPMTIFSGVIMTAMSAFRRNATSLIGVTMMNDSNFSIVLTPLYRNLICRFHADILSVNALTSKRSKVIFS